MRPNILLSDLPALLQSSKVISSKSSKSSKIRSWEFRNFQIFKKLEVHKFKKFENKSWEFRNFRIFEKLEVH